MIIPLIVFVAGFCVSLLMRYASDRLGRQVDHYSTVARSHYIYSDRIIPLYFTPVFFGFFILENTFGDICNLKLLRVFDVIWL